MTFYQQLQKQGEQRPWREPSQGRDDTRACLTQLPWSLLPSPPSPVVPACPAVTLPGQGHPAAERACGGCRGEGCHTCPWKGGAGARGCCNQLPDKGSPGLKTSPRQAIKGARQALGQASCHPSRRPGAPDLVCAQVSGGCNHPPASEVCPHCSRCLKPTRPGGAARLHEALHQCRSPNPSRDRWGAALSLGAGGNCYRCANPCHRAGRGGKCPVCPWGRRTGGCLCQSDTLSWRGPVWLSLGWGGICPLPWAAADGGGSSPISGSSVGMAK